jgi:hypothetical protein
MICSDKLKKEPFKKAGSGSKDASAPSLAAMARRHSHLICLQLAMSTTLRMPPRFPVGTPGQPWGEAERVQWRAMQSVKRSYHDEVLVTIEQMRGDFDVVQYGALSQDPARYPLFALATKNWDASKPYVLVTGGVHGYETSGVQGALQFLKTKAIEYSKTFNILVAPCVSPWGYECIQRWTINAVDPNRMFFAEGVSEEATAILNHVNSLGVSQWMCHFDLHGTLLFSRVFSVCSSFFIGVCSFQRRPILTKWSSLLPRRLVTVWSRVRTRSLMDSTWLAISTIRRYRIFCHFCSSYDGIV